MKYYATSVNKNQGTIQIPFAEPFDAPPVVIVTPYWQNRKAQVGNVPTITQITTSSVTLSDSNQGSDYFVNVLAVDTAAESLDGMPVSVGTAAKNAASVTVQIAAPAPSAVLLSAFYQNGGGVGGIETLESQQDLGDYTSNITIVSGNQASNYFVNYVGLAMSGESTVQAGVVNKIGGGQQRVYFSKPFESPPVVFVSPWFDQAGGQVGGIETIVDVTTNYFDFISGNQAGNFYVSWAAVPQGLARSRARVPQGFDNAVTLLQAMVPEEASNIAANVGSLRETLVDGKAPDASVLGIDYAAEPSMPLMPRGTVSEQLQAVARVAVDAFSCAVSLAGIWVANQRWLLDAAIRSIGATAMNGLAHLAFAFSTAQNAWQKAMAVFRILGGLWRAGAIKAMIGALRNSMKWWDWVLAALILLAQLAAWVLTDGAAFVMQLALVVLSFVTLAVDIALLVQIFGSPPGEAPDKRFSDFPRDLLASA